MLTDPTNIILVIIIIMIITYHGYTQGWFGNKPCDEDLFTKNLKKNKKNPIEQQIDILVEEINTGNVAKG